MSERNDGGPAFPHAEPPHNVTEDECGTYHSGVTVRDYFAAKAMQAIAGNNDTLKAIVQLAPEQPSDAAANLAYQWADSMLKERAK